MDIPLSEQYERQAKEEEESPVPFILKLTRFVTWVVYAVIIAQVALLVTAFFLRLAGANPDAPFAAWIYRSADRSMDPFRGIFPTRELTGESVLDLSLLFAVVIYLILAFLVDALLRWLGRKLDIRERRIADLRSAARDAEIKEYEATQQLAAQERAAQQAAAAVAAATAATAEQPTSPRPPTSPPSGQIR